MLLTVTQHAMLQCEFTKANVTVERSFATENENKRQKKKEKKSVIKIIIDD